VEHEPANFLRHAESLSLSKVADGLIDPNLVLSWVLAHLGAGSFFVGLLVPIREAGALLPQLFTAPRVQAMERRKWAWVAGCIGQGVAATGLAASLGAGAVVGFALLLMSGLVERAVLVVATVGFAALLWLGAGLVFSTLWEEHKAGQAGRRAIEQLALLRSDPQLRRFIWARGLLTSTALAPPYIVLLGAEAGQGSFDRLGALVLASSIASFLSSWVWGRLADRSSRSVLMFSGLAGAAALVMAVALDWGGFSGALWALPLVLFVLMIAYHGVRQGRVIYLVDMAPDDKRAAYTAVSNTVIGVLLLGSGVFGALASLAGAQVTLVIFAIMALGSVAVARGLEDVSG